MGKKHINKAQADLYMHYRTSKNLTQEAAAAKTDISVRSGRTIEHHNHHTSLPKKHRKYKTRSSPIDEIWNEELEPMLKANQDLQAKTLLIHLQRNHLNKDGESIYTNSIERTLQRKVARWLALNGKPKNIMFPQEHIPGEQALSDFTHFKNAEITIDGKPLKHMFYHFRLVYSKWSYLKLILSGETMQALSEGLQEALFSLGGVPKEHRTDSLSAAFKNLSRIDKKDLTNKYTDLCGYYNMIPTRNNKGKKHENGSVESSHGHLKNRIAQELLLRGSNDFKSVGEYELWIKNIVNSSNNRNCIDFNTEKLALQLLPLHKTEDYEIKSVKVSTFSIINIKGIRYSVPSRLSGHTLTIHVHQKYIEAYLGNTMVFNCERIFFKKNKSIYSIDYKHIIHSLLKKPGGFRRCKYVNEIFPNDNYKMIWKYLDETEDKKVSPKIFLRLLKIAANNNCESDLGIYVVDIMHKKIPINIDSIETMFNTKNKITMPDVDCIQHDICIYDNLSNQSITGEKYATT